MINKLKVIVKKVVNRFEYRIITRNVRGEYTRNFPYDYLTYSPWFEPWFQELYQHIKNRTVVQEDRCYIIHQLCNYACNLQGDFAECGVYKGGTTFLIASVLEKRGQGKHLHLFDTFTGMPDIAIKERDNQAPGDFADTSLENVKEYLSDFSNIDFHPGIIPDTFKRVLNKQFSFAHIDVDLYPTTLECCKYFYERMTKGGILICDDYGFLGYRKAAKAAIDDFFEDKTEIPISLHTGQCFIIKL